MTFFCSAKLIYFGRSGNITTKISHIRVVSHNLTVAKRDIISECRFDLKIVYALAELISGILRKPEIREPQSQFQTSQLGI